MLALSFTFLAGRYHATPWERHVNEGAVAWPPEPWRLLRSLIATWHHKVKHEGQHAEATLGALIESLSGELPEYHLPAASHSHTRHYMPQFKAGDTALVFDAFAAVRTDDPLAVVWPSLSLPPEQVALLDDLLKVLGYLGRAESWVEAERIDDPPAVNCRPGADALDGDTGEIRGEIVSVFAPLPSPEYQALRQRFLADTAATLPADLLSALSVDTAELRKQGWSQPPAARKVRYLRPVDAFRPVREARRVLPTPATTVQFMLVGKPLPGIEDSLRIGELFRAAVMSQAKRQFGEDKVPPVFSGHDLPVGNRHGHAFYLPWDADGDGRIDRLVLHVPLGMDGPQRRMVESLRRLWNRDGAQWRLLLEGVGTEIASPLLAQGTEWISATPYLHPWHAKKGFGIEDQIRRECRERGWPEPVRLERLPCVRTVGRELRAIEFQRVRGRRGLHQPDHLGSFWRLSFSRSVSGPVALGFGCHFGLGLFVSSNAGRFLMSPGCAPPLRPPTPAPS